jgi:hypothetical protein
MAQPAGVNEQPAAKKPRMDDMQRFYKSWAWKREHRWAIRDIKCPSSTCLHAIDCLLRCCLSS